LIHNAKPFPQSYFVGNSHEVLLVSGPIELNPQGFQGLVPGAVMDPLGVGQNAVEIEQQRVKAKGAKWSDQAIIIS
jgi:hypothetical protein